MRVMRCGMADCRCRCHTQRGAPPTWLPGMDRALRAALGRGEHPRAIAAALGLAETSVRWRCKQLGLSLRAGWRSRQEVAVVLGVSRRRVDAWCRAGLLVATPHGTRWTRVTDAEVERFVAAHGGRLFRPDGVRTGALRRLAEVAARTSALRALG